MILSLNFVHFQLVLTDPFKGSFHILLTKVANISQFVMRYSSDYIQQQHKAFRGRRRKHYISWNSEGTLSTLEATNQMRIFKATRTKHNWKYTMGSQTFKTTIMFTFLFYKEFVISHSASYTNRSVDLFFSSERSEITLWSTL